MLGDAARRPARASPSPSPDAWLARRRGNSATPTARSTAARIADLHARIEVERRRGDLARRARKHVGEDRLALHDAGVAEARLARRRAERDRPASPRGPCACRCSAAQTPTIPAPRTTTSVRCRRHAAGLQGCASARGAPGAAAAEAESRNFRRVPIDRSRPLSKETPDDPPLFPPRDGQDLGAARRASRSGSRSRRTLATRSPRSASSRRSRRRRSGRRRAASRSTSRASTRSRR